MSEGPSRRDVYERTLALTPRSHGHVSLREDHEPIASTSKTRLSPSNPSSSCDTPGKCSYETLAAFRAQDKNRQARFHALYETLQKRAWSTVPSSSALDNQTNNARLSPAEERRKEAIRNEYLKELYHSIADEGEAVPSNLSPADHSAAAGPTFDKFKAFVESKEESLWSLFCHVDQNNDMSLSLDELRQALSKAGINISQENLTDMMSEMDKDGSGDVSFEEWRDYLLLLPRQASMPNVYRYWQSHARPRLATSIANQDLDVILAEKPSPPSSTSSFTSGTASAGVNRPSSPAKGKGKAMDQENEEAESHSNNEHLGHGSADDEDSKGIFDGSGAYLLAGGLAGAVSRTATAPFDRLKVYLINAVDRSAAKLPSLSASTHHPLTAAKELAKSGTKGMGVFSAAIRDLYSQGGLKAFFVGNGLNVLKIFPESAVKFWSYEYSKRWFARNVDHSTVADISGSSRFIAGGIGGVTSQLLIYPLETWKTRVMSSTSASPRALKGNALYIETGKNMWRTGGIRAFYSGLSMGLIGVFPYSAIDMSLFTVFKNAYMQYTGDDEPGALGSLTFGAFSGGLGATSVYPLNLLRTRMQTQGTPAHPRKYTGWKDVAVTCYRNEGIRGFYKGLSPTLLKVSPSMGISWLVYEYSTSLFFPHPSHEPSDASTDTHEG